MIFYVFLIRHFKKRIFMQMKFRRNLENNTNKRRKNTKENKIEEDLVS